MNRRFGWMLMLAVGIVANSGCNTTGCHNNNCNNCNNCRNGICGHHGHNANGCIGGCRVGPVGWQRGGTDYQKFINHHAYRNPEAGSGVPTAAIAYPYYTNRGPRDFLINNPPTIGR